MGLPKRRDGGKDTAIKQLKEIYDVHPRHGRG